MAITRDKKQTLVAELTDLLTNAKGTAFAHYAGLTVSDLQDLRKAAREAGVVIKVVKNRLVRVALAEVKTYKDTETTPLVGQLVYAISADDEVAPAQVLNTFSKQNPSLVLAGGFSGEGAPLSAEDVKSLAGLPSKNQLIAEVVAQLLSPVHDTVNALSGNLHGLLDGIEAKATN
ncbi:50S ribosomal protein L10 [Candidatus Saccharibacteria bacterium 32-50-13]|nr:MAG: 50S ribosomal protein L10 [Candidatus Saccharibacteria bacterium 32-50-13]